MPQIKKPAVRETILHSALRLFEEQGYSGTTMKNIARATGVSASNIYVYFASKLEILFAIYGPWLTHRLEELERDVKRLRSPDKKLRLIFESLWDTIPAENNCFANNMMQALTTATPEERYSRETLLWAEDKVNAMVLECLPERRRGVTEQAALAHVMFMAFDGFAMNQRLVGRSRRMDKCVDVMVRLLLGDDFSVDERGKRTA